jgi:hypothetical protein
MPFGLELKAERLRAALSLPFDVAQGHELVEWSKGGRCIS